MSDITPIIVTPAAAQRLTKTLRDNDGGAASWLRIAIRGGGCSGFQYDFELINPDQIDESDAVMSARGLGFADEEFSIVIDPISMQYLVGATLDFVSTLTEQRFVFKNPNATAHCGCGSSFAA